MYKIEKINDNRIDCFIEGQIDGDEMRALLGEFLSLCEGCRNGALIFRFKDYELPTLGAIGVELSYFPQLMKAVFHKFDRCAVLADKNWVRVAASVESWFIPGMKIKAFEYEQDAEAVAWATGEAGD